MHDGLIYGKAVVFYVYIYLFYITWVSQTCCHVTLYSRPFPILLVHLHI